MDKFRKTNKPDQLIVAIAAGLCGMLIVARFVASFFPEKRLWGVSHLGYFPLSVRVVVTLAALAILIPWVNRGLRTFLRLILTWAEEWAARVPIVLVIVSVSVWLVFYLSRQKTYFLGDGWILLSTLNLGQLPPGFAEPVGRWIPFALHRLVSRWHLPPAAIYMAISCTAGVLFLLLAYVWGKTLAGCDRLGHWLVFGALGTMGIMQLFSGYVENYPLLLPAQLAYLLFGYRFIEGRGRFFLPTFLLAMLIALHLTSLMLIPSWIWLWVRAKRSWTNRKKWIAFLGGILGTCFLIGLAIQRFGSPGSLSRYAVPFSRGIPDAPGYTLFSTAHLGDFFNLYSLAVPAGLPLLFLSFWLFGRKAWEKSRLGFLLLAALAQAAFVFLCNPTLGAGRDWDLLSANGAVAVSLLLSYIVLPLPMAGRGYLVLTLVWVAFFSTLSFITLNALERPSVHRAEDLTLLDPLRNRGFHVKSLLDYYQAHGQSQNKERFIERSSLAVESILVKDSENPIAHLLRGFLLSYKGSDIASSQVEFLKALKGDPHFTFALDALADSYVVQGRLREAIACHEQRLALNPNHIATWEILGILYQKTGQLDQEIRCLEELTHRLPDDSDLWDRLGLALDDNADYRGAEDCFRKAVQLEPLKAAYHFDLGNVLLYQNKWGEAEAECRKAIYFDPKMAVAYSNLGAALNQGGKYSEADSVLREGLVLAPDMPELHFHLSLALKGQGKKEEAKVAYETYLRLLTEKKAKGP